MEYEKKYKEALEVAKRKLCFDKAGMVDSFTPNDIYEMFPELKEDDDEKIRKGIIRNLEYLMDRAEGFVKDELRERIAWLEKQGEQKPQGKTALEAINEEKVDNVNKVEPKDYSSIDPHFEKPIDKVEPKFKVGDWLCENEPNNYARFIQILEIVDIQGKERYRISRDIHNDEDIVEFDFVEKYYHKFDIEYAKDGDVLATKDAIFIFKHIDKTGLSLCKSYCEVIGNSELCLGFDFSINGVYPATKGQRDLLFSKMKEAGYEWDAKHKQLKKIEHKPAWSEEDEGILDAVISDIRFTQKAHNHEVNQVVYEREIDWLKSLKDRVGCEVNCTTTKKWSEEDIATISRVISIVKWAAYSDHSHPILNDEGANELVERLKSLKERYTWKPSDDQMDALEYHLKHTNENSRLYKETKNLYDQLKKL